MVALGAASMHAQYAPGLSPLEMSKPWSVAASLRGFYDDNYLTLPNGYDGRGSRPPTSAGMEVTPSVAFNHSVETTLMSASYIYDLEWYENKSTTDQSHQFNARLSHEFSEKYKLAVHETFVIAQEPTVIDPSIVSTPLRVEGNNMHNTAGADFMAELTKLFDLHLAYNNNVYAYQQKAPDVVGYPFNLTYPSRSADLDRMEQLATVDIRWKALPETTGVLGYQYGHIDYTSPEAIIYVAPVPPTVPPTTKPAVFSNIRNDDEHFVYVGVDQSFREDLNGSIRVGGEYLDYYKDGGLKELSPYIDASLTWQYLPGSSVLAGVKHEHSSTDVTGGGIGSNESPVLDADVTAAYISLTHKMTDKITASVMGQAQYSTFNGGGAGFNGRDENFYVLTMNLAYHINPWWMTELGYNYSKLNSEIPYRSYTRNMVYVGVRATY